MLRLFVLSRSMHLSLFFLIVLIQTSCTSLIHMDNKLRTTNLLVIVVLLSNNSKVVVPCMPVLAVVVIVPVVVETRAQYQWSS
jgi:hypothetical protein